MAIYKTTELLKLLCDITNEGYEYVDVCEFEHDDMGSKSLNFSGIDGDFYDDYGDIDSCSIPDDYDFDNPIRKINSNDYVYDLPFTLNELYAIENSAANALEYYKECINDKSYSRDTINKIKQSAIDARNLQGKLKKYFKRFRLNP